MTVTTIGDLLKQRRLKLNHNQTVAGEIMGVKGPTVSRWETGEGTPSSEQIDALVEYLGVSQPVVLAAIHEQSSSAESDGRLVKMLLEVLAGQDEIRVRQDAIEQLLREGQQPPHPAGE